MDLFNIVAVDDFNMGAMENKSLNIFNSRLVLASPETATDMDFARIEGVVGHEYFHNWTGDRVTCRDWFQLTLKEGLTVFRDQVSTYPRCCACMLLPCLDVTASCIRQLQNLPCWVCHDMASYRSMARTDMPLPSHLLQKLQT